MSARLSLRPAFWCLAAAALFGASAPAARLLLRETGPFALAGMLYLGAAIGVAPAAFLARGGAPRLKGNRASLARLAGAIVSGGIVAPVLLLAGLQRAPAASVALWLALEAPATAILARLFFREHLHARSWAAMAVIAAAGALLAAPVSDVEPASFAAASLVALACLCWGLDNNLTALVDGFTPAQSAMAKGLLAGSVNLAIGLEVGTASPTLRAVAPALALGAVSYGLSLALYIAGSQQLGAARSQMLFATAPLWGAALSWTALAEPMTRAQMLAGPIIAGALWLLRGERHDHLHTHGAMRHVHWHRHDDGHHDHAHPGLPPAAGHSHEHSHESVTHAHAHRPDLHHRHDH